MSERRDQSRDLRAWVGLILALTLALAASVVLPGCGSVADVGTGASQGSVQPVSGAYGTTGYYSAAQAADQDKKVATIARDNEAPQSKATVATTKVEKQQADATAEAVPDAQPEVVPELDPALKTTIIAQDQSVITPTTPTTPSYGMGSPYGPGGP